MTNIKKPDYKFCPKCGSVLGKKIINYKNQLFCGSCGFVFWIYPSPSITILGLTNDHKILLIRKRLDGYWAMPGGYIDWGESPEEAVRRELKEETGIDYMGPLKDIIAIHEDTLDPSGTGVEIFYFVSNLDTVLPLKNSKEASVIKLFSMDDLPGPLNQIHEKVLNDYLNQAHENV